MLLQQQQKICHHAHYMCHRHLPPPHRRPLFTHKVNCKMFKSTRTIPNTTIIIIIVMLMTTIIVQRMVVITNKFIMQQLFRQGEQNQQMSLLRHLHIIIILTNITPTLIVNKNITLYRRQQILH